MTSPTRPSPPPAQETGRSRPRPSPDARPGPAQHSPRSSCLHQLFEAQVAAHPNAEALVTDAERLTYRELNLRANRIAHHLRSLGVGPDILVGIFLERSAAMVSAILGVLKAGGAYVPLDPSYPPPRLAFMMNDSSLRVLLTQSSLLGVLENIGRPAGRAPDVVCLDTDPALRGASAKNPSPSAGDRNLAYLIYTSGSTGQPKGVALEHRNAVALIRWAGQVYSARELDGVLAGISISFDPSILDLFMPLGLGGKVILASHTLALSGLAAANEVRLMTTVPSVMKELLRINGLPSSIETINLGGEPLSIELVNRLYALPHVKRVYDLYGPTETTTCSTFALRTPGGPATIGRPIAHTQVYLLDENLQPVPPGATGELFIGGRGVARGYLNLPALTAEKFVQAAFAGAPKTRLYRTGDLARCGADGNLEFVGRLDAQVKIRGYRVEPREIELILLQHPAVAETVVLAHEEAAGERRLVAYVVLRPVPRPIGAERAAAAEISIVAKLRRHLQDHLPPYMQPSTFVMLDRFELTLNGKIARAVLPPPSRTRVAAGEYLAPSTPTERLLCQIWADLLGLKQIGVNDDFLLLGGDSLLGVAMMAEVERQTGVRLAIETVLPGVTIGRLAAHLDGVRRSTGAGAGSACVEIQPQGSRPRLFLVHGVGGGMLWGYANLARHLGPDQPIYAFTARAGDRPEELDTIEKVAASLVRELRRFQPEGPYALGGYCFGGNVAYEMARLLDQAGQRVSLLVLMNASAPNSTYYQVRWSPLALGKFLRNLGHSLDGFGRWNRERQKQFLRWKLRIAKKKARQWLGPRSARRARPEVDELLDLSAVPVRQRGLWETHVRALAGHCPRPYRGKIVLLRTRGHPLVSSYDRRCGWGELALSGVAVRVISGWHESLLEEPHVGALARELKPHLDLLQQEQGESP